MVLYFIFKLYLPLISTYSKSFRFKVTFLQIKLKKNCVLYNFVFLIKLIFFGFLISKVCKILMHCIKNNGK